MGYTTTLFATFVVLFATLYFTSGEEGVYPKDGYFKPERQCNRKGGICILDELCDSPQKDVMGCPTQRDRGAVCCDKLPKNETRCEKFGGQCFSPSDCHRPPIKGVTDCGSTNVCCVLD